MSFLRLRRDEGLSSNHTLLLVLRIRSVEKLMFLSASSPALPSSTEASPNIEGTEKEIVVGIRDPIPQEKTPRGFISTRSSADRRHNNDFVSSFNYV